MEETIIYLSRQGIKPLFKGQAIMRDKENITYPIAYIKKAKGATEKEYWQILNWLFSNNK